MNNKRLIAIIAVVLLLVVVGAVIVFTNPGKFNLPSSKSAAIPTPQVAITSEGFVPQTIKITKGSSLTWTNTDKAPHLVASDPHPTHTGLPGLESMALLTQDSYTFKFDKTGTFTYHDHLNPFKFKGTVIVE